MYCGECGTQIDDRGQFCMNCGTNVSRDLPKSASLENAKSPVDKLAEKRIEQKGDASLSRSSISYSQTIKAAPAGSSKNLRRILVVMVVAGLWILLGGEQRTPKLIEKDLVQVTYNLKNSNYLVGGRTTEAIFASSEKNAPDCDLDEGYAQGCFMFSPSGDKWSFDYDRLSDDACVLNGMHIHYELEIILPEHVDRGSLGGSIGRKWDKLVKSVYDHEQTHFDITVDMIEELPSALSRIYDQYETCEELEDEIYEVLDMWRSTLQEKHDRFDEREIKACELMLKPYEDQYKNIGLELKALEIASGDLSDVLENPNISRAMKARKIDEFEAEWGSIDSFEDKYEQKRNSYNRLGEKINWMCDE